MAGSLLSAGVAGLLALFALGGPGAAAQTAESTTAAPAVAAPAIATSAGAVRGTMILIHGGAWRGHDANNQQYLLRRPGAQLVKRGWRVVSVDYHGGRSGLQDVLDAAGAELARPTGRLLCLYGESAGGQLALVAAARLPSVDCVIGAGVPTDFQAYLAQTAAAPDPRHERVAHAIRENFGESPESTAPWEPVRLAGALRADVLLLRQAGDPLIPADQVQRFRAVRPTTQAVELEAGDPANPQDAWLHGALSAAGRATFRSAIGAFVDRAAAAHRAAAGAARRRCAGANGRIGPSGPKRFRRALRCLARNEAPGARASSAVRTTSTRMRGEVTAARAWTALRRTPTGRRQLAALAAGRARVGVRTGDPSVVVVRLRR